LGRDYEVRRDGEFEIEGDGKFGFEGISWSRGDILGGG